MKKDAVVIARVSTEAKERAKAANMNISAAVEQTLIEKTRIMEKSTLILWVEKYGISLIPNNWVVGFLEDVPMSSIEVTPGKKKGFFKNGTETYHPTLHQALIALSKRMLEDKLRVVCKEDAISLKELASVIQEHHRWFIDIVKGF